MRKTLTSHNSNSIYYPPGGILIWILIILELITFGIALTALTFSAKQDRELFHYSSQLLNQNYGVTNTIILLISGFLMATSVHLFKQKKYDRTGFFLILTIVSGISFIVLKILEYSEKIESGLLLDYNTFFSFYWLLTGFHVIHVLVGIVILSLLYFSLKKLKSNLELDDLEAGAAFWHMCDLIWLLIFPVLYLIF